MRKINEIIVHCADTPPDMDVTAADVDSWHKERGWSGIGYHYFIRRGGMIEPGRSEEVMGAHVSGHNRNSIGICLAGGRNGKNDFENVQFESLEKLLRQLRNKYGNIKICGHRDYDSKKLCPGFDVISWWSLIEMKRQQEEIIKNQKKGGLIYRIMGFLRKLFRGD